MALACFSAKLSENGSDWVFAHHWFGDTVSIFLVQILTRNFDQLSPDTDWFLVASDPPPPTSQQVGPGSTYIL